MIPAEGPTKPAASGWSKSVAVAALPVLVTLAVFVGRTHVMPVTGDEPHYLIMADSVAHDFDLDLRNNYERDFETGAIFGKEPPHAYRIRGRWMPYHTPGLAIVLALPFVLGGSTLCRAM